MRRISVEVGERAPNVGLLDADGNELELASLWGRRPLVLAFLRHFG